MYEMYPQDEYMDGEDQGGYDQAPQQGYYPQGNYDQGGYDQGGYTQQGGGASPNILSMGLPQARTNGDFNKTQMMGFMLMAGLPFDKALMASARLQSQADNSRRQESALAMQQMKMQMMQQQYDRDLMAQNQLMGLINGDGGMPQDPNMMGQQQQAAPQYGGGGNYATLKDEIGATEGMTPQMQQNNQAAPQNEDVSRMEIDPQRRKMAQILALKGDYKGAMEALKSPLQEALVKKDAQSLYEAQKVVEEAVPVRQTLDHLEEQLKKLPSPILGPVVGKAAPYLNSDAQIFDSDAKVITLLSRTLLKMPAAGFSDADRQFLEGANAGTTKTKAANLEIINEVRKRLDKAVKYTGALERKAARTGNLRGAATEFYNQEYSQPPQQTQQGQPQLVPSSFSNPSQNLMMMDSMMPEGQMMAPGGEMPLGMGMEEDMSGGTGGAAGMMAPGLPNEPMNQAPGSSQYIDPEPVKPYYADPLIRYKKLLEEKARRQSGKPNQKGEYNV